MKRLYLAVLLGFPMGAFASGYDVAVPLDVATNVTVYNCVENFTKVDSAGNAGLMQNHGTVQILDYGDSFFALSTSASAVAFSDQLKPDADKTGYRTSQPVVGVVMGKGVGRSVGTYVYVGQGVLISWNCRK